MRTGGIGLRARIVAAESGATRVLAKGLADADSKWRGLRDLECGQLSLLEVGASKQLYESQMICHMMHNAARIEALSVQYGGIEPPAMSASSPK
jgi:hypothetical protein